jgi:spore germination cell wall hydrolase CwlJ-like protein
MRKALSMKYIHLNKRLFSLVLICALFLASFCVSGAPGDLENANNQVDQLQDQIDDAKDELNSFEEQQDTLQGDLKDLNNSLSTLANDINKLESQISQKQQEMELLSIELEEATLLASEQYESMKSRIQFMYEYGSISLLEVLLESRSFADFLNRTEYVSFITSYDREKLNEYQQLVTDISQKKKELEKGEASLLAMHDNMKQKQSNVTALIQETQTTIDKTQSEISNAEDQLASLSKQLAYWEEVERKLEEEKGKEDLEKWEEIQGSDKEDFSGPYTPLEGEAYLLAAIIQCEAESEPYEGKIAVGNVVLNRVKSSRFPNTITGVIYAPKQFSPVASGRLAYRLEAGVNDECIRAATEVLNGKHITNALFFRRNNGSISGTVIGNHVFY